MEILEGNRVKVNRNELFDLLKIPVFEEYLFFQVEAAKKIFHAHIEERRRQESLSRQEKDPSSNLIPIDSVESLYIDDIRLLRFYEDLMKNPEYKDTILREHNDLYKDILLT